MICEFLTKPVEPCRTLFPDADERDAWRKVATSSRTSEVRQLLFAEAETLLAVPVPELQATSFMRYVRDGNRDEYETYYFARRRQLSVLVIAEALEYQERFLDAVIDRLWAIIVEPFWTLPAHVPDRRFLRKDGVEMRDPLPWEPYETIDLFSAETAMTVTLALQVLGKKLETVSPNLMSRCRQVLYDRCVKPFDGGDIPFWWREGCSNWTPWVVSNLLEPIRFLLASAEPERYLELLRRLCACVDAYIEHYPADGACDEGPGYWTVSPLRLFWVLEELGNMYCGNFAAFSDSRIRRMGEFIADSHLCGDYFAAFSDSPVKLPLQPDAAAYRFGERVGSAKLMDFANRGAEVRPFGQNLALSNALAALFWLPADAEMKVEPSSSAWYPVSEQLFIKANGISFAAKGGHNGEGHNHNDVGSFLYFLRGEPFFIDLGRTEYTRFTFSEKRYENWQLTSLAHNVPVIDGIGQGAGAAFAARDVVFEEDGDWSRFEFDLAGAYPAEAGLESFRRKFEVNRKNGEIVLSDCWNAFRPVELKSNFFTPCPICLSGPREAHLAGKQLALRVLLAGEIASFSTEIVKLQDCCGRQTWGDAVNILAVDANCACGNYQLRFTSAI